MIIHQWRFFKSVIDIRKEALMAYKVFTREVIIEKALDLAKEKGLMKMSMRGLARKLNSSVTPIYDLFLSKDDLRTSVFEKVIEESHKSNTYFKRNQEVLKYGIKYPVLFRDIRFYGPKSDLYQTYYDQVIDMMGKEDRLKNFDVRTLKSLHFDLMIYMNGLVEKSMVDSVLVDVDEKEMLEILEQVTELLIRGYESILNKT